MPPSEPRRATLTFIFITVVLDVLALGIIIPVLPGLVQSFMGGDAGNAARMFGLFGTVWALMQFFCSPIMGALSDRYGRRPVILFSNFGLGLDYIFMALAPSIGWLFVGRIISGITGASFTTAWAYIADVTTPEKRASGYGFVGAAWGLGFVLGPALGGVLGGINPRLPFWVASGMTLLNALYGLFVLPESHAKENRKAFSWRRANPLGALSLLRSHQGLLGLASVNFLFYLAHQVFQNVFVLYAGYRYGWGPKMVGLTLAAVGVCNIIVQAGLVRPFVARFGERVAMITGLICGMTAIVIYGFAPTPFYFWFGVPVGGLMGLYGPASQGLMTRRVGPTEQGRLQGTNTSVMGIAGLIGPWLFTLTFATFIGSLKGWQLPGAPFFLAGVFLLMGLFIAVKVARPVEA